MPVSACLCLCLPSCLPVCMYDLRSCAAQVYTQRGAFFLADAVQRCVKRAGAVIGAAPPRRGGPWADFVADMAWRDFEVEQAPIPAEIRAAAEEHLKSDSDSPGFAEDILGTDIWLWRRSLQKHEA
uniref:Uncharacterized protein n=1 Tax=Alexandrium monilatum TaxID=311494 RepID=A0A7S4SAS1_9DINO